MTEQARQAKYWVNPPAYQVVEDNTERKATGQPRVWASLEQVPVDVVVRDTLNTCWKVKADGRLRIKLHKETKWEGANKMGYPLSAWDYHAPFTEVIE